MATTARNTRKSTAPAETVTAEETAVPAGVLADAPADQSTESRLADITLAIHDKMRDYDKAQTAYDKARAGMVKAAVPVVRATVLLYMHAAATGDKTLIAERGTNAGLPAVMKLASHLGYERRRFDKFYNAALALMENDVEFAATDIDVTPVELELIAPFFTKDAERKRAERNKAKTETAGQSGSNDTDDTDDTEGTDDTPATPPADTKVILADVVKAIEHADKLAKEFAAGAGLGRETMDMIADALQSIERTLEAVVAE
jgi:hypothetical protein